MTTTKTPRRVLYLLTAAGLATTGVVVASPAQAAEVELDARMHATSAYPNARGEAEYDAERGRREFDMSIAGVRSLAGKRLTVRVHGDFVGKMTVNRYGRAHLERHSGVPKTSVGNVVRVRTSSGKLVSYGTFYRDSDD
jgi:hypothetical protein